MPALPALPALLLVAAAELGEVTGLAAVETLLGDLGEGLGKSREAKADVEHPKGKGLVVSQKEKV